MARLAIPALYSLHSSHNRHILSIRVTIQAWQTSEIHDDNSSNDAGNAEEVLKSQYFPEHEDTDSSRDCCSHPRPYSVRDAQVPVLQRWKGERQASAIKKIKEGQSGFVTEHVLENLHSRGNMAYRM